MSHYSETYRGYTVTLAGSAWHITGIACVNFLSLAAAKRYIDKLLS
jgi:hypothetical protein